MSDFDLAVLGSGSGNSLVTEHFADKRVAIVESGRFGGTCLNAGCIPTKMYVYTASVASTVAHAGRYGVDATLHGVRWREVRDRIFGRIDPISEAGRTHRADGARTTLMQGRAEFIADSTIRVTPNGGGEVSEFTADQIVIATGAHPVVPAAVQACGVPYYTSENIMRIDDLPTSLLILGGGYIAAEMASGFSAFGTRIIQVNRGSALLRELDDDVSAAFTDYASEHWDVRLNSTVLTATSDADGITATLSDGSLVRAQAMLVATGRAPNTDDLGLDKVGVAQRSDGRIEVDRHGRTTAPGVWALGDVSSPYQLKHVANHEARIVAHNLAHPGELRSFDHRFVPSAVFTEPQIASVGMTERAAREQGSDYVIATQQYSGTAYGWAMEDTEGFCKVIADRGTGKLLGAHLFGPQASVLIQPLIQAISFGQSAYEVAREQYWIHPALTEVVENALLKLEHA